VDAWTLTGTHTGAQLFGLPAAGRRVAFAGIDWLRVRGGLVAELWHVEDMATMADQLGMATLPPPQPAPLPGDTLVLAGPADAAVVAAAQARLAGSWRTGSDAGCRALQALAATAPDLAVHVAALLADGPLVAARLVLAGTDAASGRPFAINAMDVVAPATPASQAWHVADHFSRRAQIAG
jgi:predicted ester cyclase